MFKLGELSKDCMEWVVNTRREMPEMLRTSQTVSLKEQEKYFDEVISARGTNARYWGVYETVEEREYQEFVGMVGINNIQWENRTGEISFLMKTPSEDVAIQLLNKAFSELNLYTVCAEVYTCSRQYDFWMDIVNACDGFRTTIPYRKYHAGIYWDSVFIVFERSDFLRLHDSM